MSEALRQHSGGSGDTVLLFCLLLGPRAGSTGFKRSNLVNAAELGHKASLLPANSHPDASCTELPRAGHSKGPQGSSVQDPSGGMEVRGCC